MQLKVTSENLLSFIPSVPVCFAFLNNLATGESCSSFLLFPYDLILLITAAAIYFDKLPAKVTAKLPVTSGKRFFDGLSGALLFGCLLGLFGSLFVFFGTRQMCNM